MVTMYINYYQVKIKERKYGENVKLMMVLKCNKFGWIKIKLKILD